MAIQIKSSDHSMMSDINVTPLVDVMLVLLIVFIVTAPLLMQAVPVKLPTSAATTRIAESRPVQLSIDRKGQIYIGTNPVTRKQLKDDLLLLRNRDSEISIQLMADEQVPYGDVAKVMGIVQQVGIAKLSFVMISE